MALKLKLNRDYLDHCTVGTLYHQGVKFCRTIERPWRNNQPSVSCVPPGTYQLAIHHSPKFGKCISIAAPSLGVTVEREAASLRTHCLFHAANTASQLQGCIAPGVSFGTVDVGRGPEWAVTQSRNALEGLINLLEANGGEATLEISL